MLARLHHLNRLRRVQPRLREQRDRIDVAGADRVERIVRFADAETLRCSPEFAGVDVAQRHPPDFRMLLKEFDEVHAELPESDDADAEFSVHRIFTPPLGPVDVIP